MPPIVGAAIFAFVIAGLFYLDRGHRPRVSKALWIPGVWLFISSSRPLSLWLGMAPSASTDVYLEGSPIDRAMFTVLIFAGLAVVIRRVDKTRLILAHNFPAVLFVLFCAVSILWSEFPLVALKRYTKAVGDLVMVLVVLTELHPVAAITRLVTRLGFLLFPMSVVFVKYYPQMGRLVTGSWITTFTGVTTQKNSLGLICMSYGVGFLWMLYTAFREPASARRRYRLLAYSTVLLMILWLLKMSDSKTSIVGLAMAAGVTLLVSQPLFIRKKVLIHGLVFAVSGISVFALFFDSGGSLLENLGRDPSLTGRTDIWRLVLDVPISRWVGAGFESFWLGSRLTRIRASGFGFPINEAHNGYLEVYLNLGWAGVTLLSLLLITGYRRVTAAFQEDPQTAALFLGLFLTTMFESLTEAAFRMLYPSWLFLLLVIVAPQTVLRNRPRSIGDRFAENEYLVCSSVAGGLHRRLAAPSCAGASGICYAKRNSGNSAVRGRQLAPPIQ